MDAENTNFDEFFGAMGDDVDYQTGDTDNATDTADTSPTDTDGDAAEGAQEGAESEEGRESEGDAQESVTDNQGTEPAPAAETFTLRVNKADQTVTRDEMIAYAQQGVDYPRVKAALEAARNDNAALQARVSQTEEVYTLIADLAKESNMEIGALLDQFRIARYEDQGMSKEAATERIGRERAERELAQLKGKGNAQQTETDARKERAEREVREFNQLFPGVQLTEDVVEKLTPDVQGGMTLSQAYQKHINAEQAAEIQRLQAELAAEKQNKANQASSPGSLRDSGTKKTKDKFDDFFSAFDD